MRTFETMAIPDLLKAMRYCQKRAEEKQSCNECYYFKREYCPGEETRKQNTLLEDLMMEQREQM